MAKLRTRRRSRSSRKTLRSKSRRQKKIRGGEYCDVCPRCKGPNFCWQGNIVKCDDCNYTS